MFEKHFYRRYVLLSLSEMFDCITMAGMKVLPVPGTNKYFISFQDGQSVYVPENILLSLAQFSVKDPHLIMAALKNSQISF
jgi:hypothetical protein